METCFCVVTQPMVTELVEVTTALNTISLATFKPFNAAVEG